MLESVIFTEIDGIHKISVPYKADTALSVFDIGYHKTPPKHKYGPAVRPYFLLHLIENGTATLPPLPPVKYS